MADVIKTIKPAGGGDYTTLAAWIAARKGDLVARGGSEIAECYGGGDLGWAVILDGDWVTSESCRIIIRAAAGEKHPGYYDANKARIGDKTSGLDFISVTENNVDFEDMQIMCQQDGGSIVGDYRHSGGSCYIKRSIIFGGDSAGQIYNENNASGGTLYLLSCFMYGMGTGNGDKGVYTGRKSHTYIYNCTIWGPSNAVSTVLYFGHATAFMTENNNYLWGGQTVYGGFAGTWSKGANTACYNTEAVTAALDNIAKNSSNFTDVGAGTEDCHLPSGSALLLGGANVALGSPDIDNVARPTGRYDIGADQKSEALSGSLFVLGV